MCRKDVREGTQVGKESRGRKELEREKGHGSRVKRGRYSVETDFFAYKVKWNKVVRCRLASLGEKEKIF